MAHQGEGWVEAVEPSAHRLQDVHRIASARTSRYLGSVEPWASAKVHVGRREEDVSVIDLDRVEVLLLDSLRAEQCVPRCLEFGEHRIEKPLIAAVALRPDARLCRQYAVPCARHCRRDGLVGVEVDDADRATIGPDLVNRRFIAVIVRECQAGFEELFQIDERRPVVSADGSSRLEIDALAAAIFRRGRP